jgi:hypothetical protein
MRFHHGRSSLGFVLVAALFLVVSACDSSNGPSNPLIGSWNATSFTAQGTDYIANGMGLVLTIEKGGTYAVAFTNDQVGACNPGPDCTDGGDFVRNGNQLTLDRGTADETIFTYSIQGTTLTLTGDINGALATIVLDKI